MLEVEAVAVTLALEELVVTEVVDKVTIQLHMPSAALLILVEAVVAEDIYQTIL
jgi:S-adenosylmethionine:tRNA-ribosyltransferase-isomerase (queuine synthetase)